MSKGEPMTKITAKTNAVASKAVSKSSGKSPAQREGNLIFKRVSPDRIASPEDVSPEKVKVRITMYVDLDVLNHFKQMAQLPGSAGYQTLMNAALRQVVIAREDTSTVEDGLLGNEAFLEELSRRVSERIHPTN
jgi:uncharacterized protein (DUF4415 family)